MTTASHRRYLQLISSLNRRSELDGIAPSPSTPSSIIAWAWYVDGVRKPAENLSVAAHLANAGEGFVWLGLKDPRMGI
jgi:magnesium transporter